MAIENKKPVENELQARQCEPVAHRVTAWQQLHKRDLIRVTTKLH